MHDIIFGILIFVAGTWTGFAIASLLNMGRDEERPHDEP